MLNRSVVLVTDSAACLPKELVEDYGIEIVPIEFGFCRPEEELPPWTRSG